LFRVLNKGTDESFVFIDSGVLGDLESNLSIDRDIDNIVKSDGVVGVASSETRGGSEDWLGDLQIRDDCGLKSAGEEDGAVLLVHY
jgi:hypothetical protein